MFSDKHRILTIVITAALILAGCFYAAQEGPLADPEPEVVLNNPDNVGHELIVRYAKVEEVAGASAKFKTQGYQFTGNFFQPIDFEAGVDISFTGTIVSPKVVDIQEYHIHPWRPLKYYFSLPAVVFIIYLLFKKYRFNWRRVLWFEKKKTPLG